MTKEDFPPDAQLTGLTETIQRRGHDLLDSLESTHTKDAKAADPFRQKLVDNLQSLVRDVGGAHSLFVDVGMENPVDLAITHLELPTKADGQQRQVFGPDETIVLRCIVQATGKDMFAALNSKIGSKVYQQSVELQGGSASTGAAVSNRLHGVLDRARRPSD